MDLATASNIAADFTAGWEGFSPSPYYDVNGYAIGYGNHYYEDGSAVGADDDPITQDRALQILTFYITQNANALIPQITAPINNNQLAALVDLRYNCGTITTTLLDLINSGADAATVAAQILKTCTTSGGVPDPDLTPRIQARAALYQSGAGSLPVVPLILIAAGLAYVLWK
jgi:GH24 family phage-related lysozyme (muramidase)